MNGQQIKRDALIYSGLRDMPDDYVLLYINKAMLELATLYDSACKKDYVIVETEGNVWEYLGNIVAAKRVLMIDDEEDATRDRPYDRYLLENERILFKNKGRYRVEVIEVQDELERIENTPAINQLFHLAICYYVAYEETARVFMHEDTNKDSLYAMFLEKARIANTRLVMQKRGRKKIAVPDFV